MDNEFEKEQNEEIRRRVEYLEKNVDMNSSDFGVGNWIGVGITIVLSATMLIVGAFL